MTTSLPRRTPAEQQVDPSAVWAFLDTVEGRPYIEMRRLVIAQIK
jgi:hypothetical protein